MDIGRLPKKLLRMAVRPRGKINNGYGKGERVSDKTKVCDTCAIQKAGSVMSEAEAQIHQDLFPTHSVVSVNEEPISN